MIYLFTRELLVIGGMSYLVRYFVLVVDWWRFISFLASFYKEKIAVRAFWFLESALLLTLSINYRE
ncbi:hypothetical protein F5884DRAFT_801433 [Xylogone sp. PMI_703]|nr:hypothetical protein F5884DRAFT_801433 [Xylogone sp. PMI_703]